ncbi:MAG: VacJ family lipoprotein [Proteobacteria bacterium]|nr:VacJ family lipoprotein [Pseudomonadota bacterium]
MALAWATTAAVSAPKSYDFDRFLNQSHPFAAAASRNPVAPAPSTTQKPAITPSGYKFDRFLNQPHPFAGNQVDTAQPANRDTGLRGPAITPGKLYNMDRALNKPHPFTAAGLPVQPIQPISPGPSTSLPVADPVEELFEGKKEAGDNDPLESMNRFFFGFNEVLNIVLLGPIARGYNAVFPKVIRTGIASFMDNLSSPVVLANDLLQGEFRRAGDTTARLAINSTVGILGIIDVAEKLGFEKHREDFGQTMAVWGVGEGFYLVLPIFGPSNPRDAIGIFGVDPFFDPLGYYLSNTNRDEFAYARTGINGLVTYAGIVDDLDRVRETSVDFYGALRSLYRQRRESEIRNNKVDEQKIPDFEEDIR